MRPEFPMLLVEPNPFGPVTHVGPYSRGHTSEKRVIGAVVEGLLAGGWATSSIQLEYRLGPGNRVDVAAIGDDLVVLVECKGWKVTPETVRQGMRYLTAGRRLWPEATVRVVLTAPNVSPSLGPLPDGISVLTMVI